MLSGQRRLELRTCLADFSLASVCNHSSPVVVKFSPILLRSRDTVIEVSTSTDLDLCF